MQMKPTINTVLDTRRIKKSGRYPVKLRITFQKDQKYYSIGFDMSEDEYDAIKSDIKLKQVPIKQRKMLQETKIKCDAQVVKANEVINKMSIFSFSLFEKKFLTGKHSTDSVYLYYENTIKKQKEEARVGTASSYNTSMNSLKKFYPKLLLRDITVEFLREYESVISKKSVHYYSWYLSPATASHHQPSY
jgi:integrase/recombinase XerD